MNASLPADVSFYIPARNDTQISLISSTPVIGVTTPIPKLEGTIWHGFCIRSAEAIDVELMPIDAVLASGKYEDPLREGAVSMLQAIPNVSFVVTASPHVRYPTLATEIRSEGASRAYSAVVRFQFTELSDIPDLQAYVAALVFFDSPDPLGEQEDDLLEFASSNIEERAREAIASLSLMPRWRLPCTVETAGSLTLGVILLDSPVRDDTWRVRLFLARPIRVESGTVLARSIDFCPCPGQPVVRLEAVLGTVLEATAWTN